MGCIVGLGVVAAVGAGTGAVAGLSVLGTPPPAMVLAVGMRGGVVVRSVVRFAGQDVQRACIHAIPDERAGGKGSGAECEG